MAEAIEPIVGHWYQYAGREEKFEVVAVDEETGNVEVQHFDGDLEEFDLDSWNELEIEAIEEPEDWTGPVDDIERDDLGYSEDEYHPGEDLDKVQADLDRRGRELGEESWDAEGNEEED